MKNGTATAPEIPLDLGPLMSSLADGEDYSFRVEKLPARGRLSNGRNNGDQTWSLKPADLAGLTYLPPEEMNQPHTLAIRVVRIEDDAATTVALHDIPVAPGAVARNDPYRSLDTSKPMEEQDEYDEGEEEDEDRPDYAQTLSDQMRAARASSASELDGLLIKKGSGEMALPTESETVARLEQSLQETQEASAAELAAATARYEKAEAALEALQRRVESLQETETALDAAKNELTEALAQQQARHDEQAHAWQEGSQAAIEAELKKARAAWKTALEKRLADSAADADRQLQLAQKEWRKKAKGDLETAETALKELQGRVKESQGAQIALKTTQNEYAVLQDRKQFLEKELAAARLEIEQARNDGSQETGESELAAARAAWETELKRRLTDAAADTGRQIEEARKEWQDKSDRALEAARTRAEKAESALSDLQVHVESLRESESALGAARVEISVLQAQNRASDSEMNERVAAAAKDAEQRLEQARTEWETSAAAELAAAGARYATAEASVESLERRVEELQADLATMSDRQRDEAAAAETNPPVKYGRAAAGMGWKSVKWIWQRAIAAPCRFVWRRRPRGAIVPIVLAAAAGIVIGVTYYPTYGLTVMKASEPVIARIRQESVPLWRFVAVQIAEIRKEDEPEIHEERVTINVGVANVREGPSTSTKTVATLPRHTDLTVIERRGNWVLVQLDGEGVQTGWIYNALLIEAESY